MIYVLDGGAPGKVYYFTERAKRFDDKIILLDNHGQKDNASNFEWLLKNIHSDDKVIIISEHQLNYLQNNKQKYLPIKDNLIYLRSSNSDDFNYLATKTLFAKLPTLGKGIKVVDSKEAKKYIDNPNYIVKDESNTGSNGIFYNGSELIKGSEIISSKRYIIQDFYSLDDWDFYSVPVIIKKGKLTCCIPLSNYTQFKSVVELLKVDSHVLPLIIKSMNEVISVLGLIDGVCEPEFVVNKLDKSIRIMDLNPRWSFDCSTSTKIINEEYNKEFDFLRWYMEGLEFFPDHDGDLWRLGKTYCKCTT